MAMSFTARQRLLIQTTATLNFTSSRYASTAAVSTVAVPEERLHASHTNEQFVAALRSYYESESPVKIVCGETHFAATETWKDINYLRQKIDFCDVEIGAAKRGDKVSIPFEQYAQYLDIWKPGDQLLYLAQNDLPSQLVGDIEIPAVCTDASSLGHGKLYNTMIWIGPSGCVSPLHFDPLDNFLIQIVGRKRVFLVDKEVDSNFMYVGEEFQEQSNMSAVDVETPNYDMYPKFKQVPQILSTELRPGDILFIPSKWWHAVRSLEYSISVNAWWR
jgi:Cupin-like domain